MKGKLISPRKAQQDKDYRATIAPAEDTTKRYSKLQIMRKLKELGAWEGARQAIEAAGAWDEFLVAQDLSSEDPLFQFLIPGITALVPEGVEVESILSQCEI